VFLGQRGKKRVIWLYVLYILKKKIHTNMCTRKSVTGYVLSQPRTHSCARTMHKIPRDCVFTMDDSKNDRLPTMRVSALKMLEKPKSPILTSPLESSSKFSSCSRK
jgi:hypothetical protein